MTRIPSLLTALAVACLLSLSACSLSKDNVRDENGAITEANDKASVFDMKVGDCFNDPGAFEDDEATEVGTLPAVPCDESHTFEVYATATMPGDDFPGDTEAEKQADDLCSKQFEPFVGIALEESEFGYTYLYPTSDTWRAKDREITCLVGAEDPTKGTLKGAKR